jgi:zinc/manganese transport system permease protein
VASVTLLTLAVIYRGLLLECCDPGFLAAVKGRGGLFHQIFLALVVLNLVAAFQVLGTLLALGLMILPALTARFWSERLEGMIAFSILFAFASSLAGLYISYYATAKLPSGPTIIVFAGICYIVSLIVGPYGGILFRYFPRKHVNLKETT